MVDIDSKETIKTFLLLFCIAGIAILSVNTFMIIQNQSKILENQEKVAKPLAIENNQRIKNIESILENSTVHVESR